MPDEIPPLTLGLGDNNECLVFLGELGSATDMATLLRLAPGLASEAHARELALAANHFAHESEYRVIENPGQFANDYRARIEREDPGAEWQENLIRLRDYGVPDFNQIEPPKFDGGKLTFYAVDAFLGVPYKVEAANLQAAPVYTSMPLTPLPSPPRPQVEREIAAPAPGAEVGATATASATPDIGSIPPLNP